MKTSLRFYSANPALPDKFACVYQPYGAFTISNCRWENYNGFLVLTGTVIEGTDTGTMFGHSASRSIVGETREIYSITPEELAQGNCIRIAM